MSVNRIESIVDSIARINNTHSPDSEAYQLRNPLKLKSFAKPGRHLTNSDGVRVFGSMLAGLKAACFDCELKLKGLSRAGLKPTDNLENLLRVYGFSEKAAIDNCVSFIKRALKDDTITSKTLLSFFLEGTSPTYQLES
jgi:hypothetical protein